MADETQYACPFCGEMSSSRNRGKHFAWHRRQGDVPLALDGSVGRLDDESGLWGIAVSVAETGAPLLIPDHYKGLKTKRAAEQALRRFVDSVANGADRKRTTTKTTVVKDPAAPVSPVSDADIVAALVKLAGVASIPVKQFTQVSEWVAQTRTLMKEIAR